MYEKFEKFYFQLHKPTHHTSHYSMSEIENNFCNQFDSINYIPLCVVY